MRSLFPFNSGPHRTLADIPAWPYSLPARTASASLAVLELRRRLK